MKKTILLIMLSFLLANVLTAQWYHRKCGVVDISNCTEAEYECLWVKSTKVIRTGVIITTIGTTSILAGILVLTDDKVDMITAILIGMTSMMGGVMLDCVGIPVWITGGVRRSQLRNVSGHGSPGSGSLRIHPSFQVNQLCNTHCLSMGVTLHFSL